MQAVGAGVGEAVIVGAVEDGGGEGTVVVPQISPTLKVWE